MKTRGLAFVALLSLGIALAWWLGRTPSPERHAISPQTQTAPSDTAVAADVANVDALAADRERSAQPQDDAGAAPASPSSSRDKPAVADSEAIRVDGIVVELDGSPRGGVDIAIGDRKPAATSALDGRFSFEVARSGLRAIGLKQMFSSSGDDVLRVVDDRYVAVRSSRVSVDQPDQRHVLVIAPRIDLAGRVLDARGAAAIDATIELDVPGDALSRVGEALDRSIDVWSEIANRNTDSNGGFELVGIPAFPGAKLRARNGREQTAAIDQPSFTRRDLLLVFDPPADAPSGIRGVVVRADGAPAADASVIYGNLRVEAGDDGAFVLELDRVDPQARLVAVERGYQPAFVNDLERWFGDGDRAGEFLRIVLGPATLSIAGTVLDAEGKPCRGWRVRLLDGQALVIGRIPPEFVEQLAGSDPATKKTRNDGAFAFAGLSDRDYRVSAYHEKTLAYAISDPIRAGATDAIVRVPADLIAPRIAGRVVSRRGGTLAGVRVQLSLKTYVEDFGFQSIDGGKTITDHAGAFALERVPLANTGLVLDGDAILPARFELGRGLDLERLEILVDERAHFRVAPASEASVLATWAHLVDAEGETTTIWNLTGGGWSSSRQTWLEGGKTPQPLCAAPGRYELALLGEAGEELARKPIELVPGEIAVVEY